MARHFAGRHGGKRTDWKKMYEEVKAQRDSLDELNRKLHEELLKVHMQPAKPEPNSEWQEGFVKIGNAVHGMAAALGAPEHMRIQLAVWVRKP